MGVGEVMLLSRNEVEEFISSVGRIENEGWEIESQSEEGWDFSDKSSPSL